MASWGSIGPGARVLVLVLGGGVLAGSGYAVWRSTQGAVPAATPVVAVPEPAAKTEPEKAESVAASVPIPSPDPSPAPPMIDTWRVAPDGEALVAGIAEPNAVISVVVDDRPVAEGVALASGEFVLQFTLPPNPAPSLLWLSMTSADGAAPVASPEMVAIAPIPGPVTVAAVQSVAEEVADAAEGLPQTAPVAQAAPAALLVTGKGAVVPQGAAPVDPALAAQVMIDTITYAPTGAVQVGGRGDAGATVRLYLDTADAAAATVGDDGRWLVTLGDGEPGLYTLRVDQTAGDGKVTSRFETPFKRETVEALALATGQPRSMDLPVAGATVAAAPDPDAAQSGTVAADPGAADPPAAALADAAPQPVELAEAAPPPVTITVQPGFTLWGIAQDRLGDGVFYVQVYEANRDKIRNPDLIYPGQVFSVPAELAP